MSTETTDPALIGEAHAMMRRAELRVGGRVGDGSPAAFTYLRERGWISPTGGLSPKGVTAARLLRSAPARDGGAER